MCRHDKDFTITEISAAEHQRYAIDGRAADFDQFGNIIGNNEMGNILYYVFACNICGVRKRFQTLSSQRPLYIRKAIEVLFPND